ncbi:MAG: HDIG domain-containing protein [Candidatus Omnitrophica bacterium]|nr:HDIG domain-containing protein [Candidatus Omnitrophota bacterium]
MIEIIKIKKDKIFSAIIVFLLLTGYCLVAGLSLIIPLLLLTYGFHLILFKRADSRRLLHLSLLLVLVVAGAFAMTQYSRFCPYFVPVASVAMLTMLLFNDLQLSFSMSFMASSLVALTVGVSLDYMLVMFIGGLVGAYAVRDARTRGAVLWAGLMVGAVQALGFFLAHPGWSKELFIDDMRPLLINGFLVAGFVLATLKLFEILFGELTSFSLLELSDSLNQPLLKRLAFEAPGTYHHSLVLSNLAGAAADAIGANALLTRVGAYYHDIGKLEKPEYFTENQMMADNKHDELEPSMSRLVILNHVKEGVETALKHKLSPRIIDFIQQHHGTSVIHYFYQKALEGEEAEAVHEENYRYPGPKPRSREVAIVLLADSVEGATRAMDEHTPTRIDEVVRKVVNNKFIDGQLDECNLTLREIEAICTTFSRVLSAMYHVRVKYPNPNKNGH